MEAGRWKEKDGGRRMENRGWASAGCKAVGEIRRRIVEVVVVLGGGRRHWLPAGHPDRWDARGREGRRLDGRDLAADWVRAHRRRGQRAAYVRDASELAAVDLGAVDYLLGLFAHSHLEFAADRAPGPRAAPTLVEMAEAATRLLRRGPSGFFLLLEGGRIDHAHHHNNAFRALDETLALEAALRAALALVDARETLVVLAADHGSVLSLGGLGTPRGRPVLGADSKVSDVDGLPYSLLLYGNGPGHAAPRPVPANDSWDPNTIHGAAAPRVWATHGGEVG
ncbi:Membrane-bound alkaline phosphatase, partial [Gryllus bimaculatus]